MKKFVADTMALILHLEKRKMPEIAKALFREADAGKVEILVPAMVLAEIGYLSEKGRIELKIEQVESYFNTHNSFQLYPLNMKVVEASFEIDDIHELHDRLIAGTAKLLGVEIITNDPVISNSKFVHAIWKHEPNL